MQNKPLSVYIHWPYCKSKCPYCDFYKNVAKNINQGEIINTYIQELDYYKKMLPDRTVRSVFFGGGTPSLIEPVQINRLIEYIFKIWPSEKNPEITLEANPNTDKNNLFADLKNAGINRLSLGVQALSEPDLKFLGRTHTLTDALKSIESVIKHFNNHSIDLIYARPNQDLNAWLKELTAAVSLGLKHLSLYQLTIEDGTVFARQHIQPLEEDKASEMYSATVTFLRAHNYPRYEVSNFAPKKYESKHNKCYWRGDEYIGIGPSAHGRLKINGQFLSLTHPHQTEYLTAYERAEELLLMGLRLQAGIDKKHFKSICGLELEEIISQQKLQELIKDGYLIDTPNVLQATDSGFLLLDYLILQLLS